MSTITTRAGKGSPLTNNEVDANFTNLNTDKAELSGATFTGEITANGGIALGDNDKATFGAGDDLQIYHNGSNSIIEDSGSGDLVIKGSTNIYMQSAAGETYLRANSNGPVTLYHNNASKLATTSTGIDVTGTATMDGLSVAGDVALSKTAAGANILSMQRNGAASPWKLAQGHTATNDFEILEGGTTRLALKSGGDISFYEDTGTTPKLFWDASAERLGIGTSSPSAKLTLNDAGQQVGIDFKEAGTTRAHIEYDGTIPALELGTNGAANVVLKTSNTERMRIDSSGNVGIGDSSPASITSDVSTLSLNGTNTGVSGALAYRVNGSTKAYHYINSGNLLHQALEGTGQRFLTNNTEAMRIDSSGNLLVGKTASNIGVAGIEAKANGTLVATVNGAETLFLNRLSTDGTILDLRKDGTNVGSIGTSGGDLLIHSSASSHVGLRFGEGYIFPTDNSGATANGTVDLGISGASAFKDLHLSGTAHTGLNIHLQDSGTTRGKIELNASDTDDLDIKAVSLGSNMKFFTVDTERMRIDSSGSVGIGNTPNSTFKLDVEGSIRTDESGFYVSPNYSSGNNVYKIYDNSGQFRIESQIYGNANVASSPIVFGTSNTDGRQERMRIDSSGNVGIGTSSPNAGLELNLASGDGLLINSADIATIKMKSTGGSVKNWGFATTNLAASDFGIYQSNSNGGDPITAGTARMYFNASGNVGIGTSSPSSFYSGARQLVVGDGSGENGITIYGGAEEKSYLLFADGVSGNSLYSGQIRYDHSDNSLQFATNGNSSERMRIDSSGNLLVGTTDSNVYNDVTGTGTVIQSNGIMQLAANNGTPLYANRQGTDGDIIDFRKDGSTVGSIGTDGTHTYFVGNNGSNGCGLLFGVNVATPVNRLGTAYDGFLNLGTSSNRFKDLYLSGTGYFGTSVGIGTSSPVQALQVNGRIRVSTDGSNGGDIGVDASGLAFSTIGSTQPILFERNNYTAESMRIDSSGNLLVGTTSNPYSGRIVGYGAPFVSQATGTSASDRFYFVNGNGIVGYIRTSGSSTSYNTSSDQRLKENIADADDAGSKIDAIQVRKYDWKADGSHQDYGMIAQELQAVAPEAVSGDADSEDMMGVDYSKLVPMLIKEIQSLRNRVAQLEE